MTRITMGAGGLLLLSTAVANAGALDRSGQPVGVIFEQGNYAELSYGFTSPDVQGVFPVTLSGSGNVAADYSQVQLSFKYDVTDRISLAAIIDQPFGADVDYTQGDADYPIAGSVAEFRSTGVTVLGRYEFGNGFSLHGGARLVTIDADLLVDADVLLAPGVPVNLVYEAEYEPDSDVGFIAGAAYERPEIALRVALTYSSETEFSNETAYAANGAPGTSRTEYTMPQSVNLDVRTGIAAGTLLFGSVRWVDWSETQIDSEGYFGNPVVGYDGDYVTYTLGVGRQLTDRLSGSAQVSYEDPIGSDFDPAIPGSGVSNLSPTDGQLALQLGAMYKVTDNLELSGGVRYSQLGDATTRVFGSEFEDNDAVSLGLRVGYRF